MSTTMGNSDCEWVRLRLPLWVGVSDDRTERNGEGGDLSPDDRRSIERHLACCAGCNQHQVGLERALRVLGSAAGSLAVSPKTPSLWPALERRMVAHQVRSRPRWLRTVHGISDRGLRAWFDFHAERPLRFAWIWDSLGEALKGARLGEVRAWAEAALRHGVRRPAWILGTGMVSAVLVLMIGLAETRRWQGSAQSIIHANRQPIPGADVAPRPSEVGSPALASTAEDDGEAPGELSQSDPIPVSDAPHPQLDAAPATKGAPASTTTVATPTAAPVPPPSPSRWNYDLEHGTPMPPHARDVKPVY